MVAKKFNVSERDLRELYTEVRNRTSNFHTIDPSVISENSKRILVFRLALGLSSDKFAKICNRTHGSIENLERNSKQLNYRVASHYMGVIKNHIHDANLQLEYIIQTFRKFKRRALNGVSVLNEDEISKFAKLGALASVNKRKTNEKDYFKASLEGVKKQQLTNQEKRIEKLLEENKIKHKIHEFVDGENIDFVIKNGSKIFLIGCSSSKLSNLTHHARRLMYQAYRVKHNHKNNIIFSGVLGTTNGVLKKDDVPLGAKRLLEEICDAWFVDYNLNDLISFLKTGS